MKIFVLVGKSGTGKSYQAVTLCRDNGIESIIDDGLFIFRGEEVSGKSAKREATKVGAIKTAIFTDELHCEEVREAIKQKSPKTMLVIGTSDAMVEKIVSRLELGDIDVRVYIEDITTEGERRIARKQRHSQGKHVVPVPALKLRRQFSGYFMSPLSIFKGLGASRGSIAEKTVVRPTYSYLGNYTISDRAISDIVKGVALQMKDIVSLHRIRVMKEGDELWIKLSAVLKHNTNVVDAVRTFQKESCDMIENMTAFSIYSFDVEVRSLV